MDNIETNIQTDRWTELEKTRQTKREVLCPEGVRHERDILNAGRKKLDFAEIDQCKPVLLGLSLAGNLVKPLLSLYGTEWRKCGDVNTLRAELLLVYFRLGRLQRVYTYVQHV